MASTWDLQFIGSPVGTAPGLLTCTAALPEVEVGGTLFVAFYMVSTEASPTITATPVGAGWVAGPSFTPDVQHIGSIYIYGIEVTESFYEGYHINPSTVLPTMTVTDTGTNATYISAVAWQMNTGTYIDSTGGSYNSWTTTADATSFHFTSVTPSVVNEMAVVLVGTLTGQGITATPPDLDILADSGPAADTGRIAFLIDPTIKPGLAATALDPVTIGGLGDAGITVSLLMGPEVYKPPVSRQAAGSATFYSTATAVGSGSPTTPSGTYNAALNQFTIIPHTGSLTQEQSLALHNVLQAVKPAGSVVTIGSEYASKTLVTQQNTYADDCYWNFKQYVNPNPEYASVYALAAVGSDGYAEVLHPPGSEYQGEQIIYNPDVSVVSGYALDQYGNPLTIPYFQTLNFPDGTVRSYTPQNAVADRAGSLAARLVNEAILQGNLWSIIEQGGWAQPADLYIDGISVGTLAALDNTPIVPAVFNSENYWSSPPRLSTDPTQETLEIRFPASKYINGVELQLPTYPHTATLEYWTGSAWSQADSTTILNSVPSVIPTSLPANDTNPQHNAPGHWQIWQASFAGVSTTRLRLRLQRTTNGTQPVNDFGVQFGSITGDVVEPAPYSLGTKNLLIYYSISTRADWASAPTYIYSTDMLGSKVKWTVRQNSASNATGSATGIWRSAPQPSVDAVVNLYIDARNGSGLAQAFNAIYLDPVYSGAHLNIYVASGQSTSLGVIPTWSSVVWTPINLDFTCRKGTLRLPMTSAQFVKLEFTGLSAEQINLFTPIQTTTQYFPPGARGASIGSFNTSGYAPPGADFNEQSATTIAIDYATQPVAPSSTLPPTAAVVSTDPNQRTGSSWEWRYQDWHSGYGGAGFTQVGTHQYTIVNDVIDGNIAFFAGVNKVALYRMSVLSPNETPFFDELFLDEAGLNTGLLGWNYA